ncbi:GldM family protein [Bacteroides sp. UBA939]|uniref:GldM family protein n=1 Tax=Bacteroides sp. UBA939 TaxID=1946092 RepID=UPI0025BB5A6D|nr:GldM family protein [Bacteroides sp. UBA939]
MKQVSLLCLLIICLSHGQVNAQCGNALVEKAASQSGADAVYLREFKVKFDGSERGKAIPVAKFPVLLSKNTTYRFNVCSAEEFEGKVILQLYLKDKLIGSTFDTQTSTDLQHFDFTCKKAATYEVVMSFNEGKPGCAVGILSLITAQTPEPEDEELDILYAAADNPVMIYDDENEYAKIEVSIDNGTVTRVEGINYIIRPDESGTATLTIRVLNRKGELKEFKQKKFAVLMLP